MRTMLAASLVAAAALSAPPPANADARRCVHDFLAGVVTAEPGPGGSGVAVHAAFVLGVATDPPGAVPVVLGRTSRLRACVVG